MDLRAVKNGIKSSEEDKKEKEKEWWRALHCSIPFQITLVAAASFVQFYGLTPQKSYKNFI